VFFSNPRRNLLHIHSFAKAELRAKRERGRCEEVGGERVCVREREIERRRREGGRERDRRGGEGDRMKARARARSREQSGPCRGQGKTAVSR
jgi:hypothetical protein